jgi:ankyrin repeat protein
MLHPTTFRPMSLPRSIAVIVLLIAFAACDAREPPPQTQPADAEHAAPAAAAPQRAQPAPAPPAAPPAQRNLAMGTGEARDPQPFTREQRLLDAVQRNDRATVARALELGVPVGTKDDLGRNTLLLAASDAGDLDLVRFLHDKGAAVDEPDVQARGAISFAAADGKLEIVRWLADHGALVDRPDWLQRTPLFHAALGGHADVVALLIDRGASPDTADQFGDTPLIVACAKGNAAAARLLVARGANVHARDQEGRTARERSAPGVEPCLALPQS